MARAELTASAGVGYALPLACALSVALHLGAGHLLAADDPGRRPYGSLRSTLRGVMHPPQQGPAQPSAASLAAPDAPPPSPAEPAAPANLQAATPAPAATLPAGAPVPLGAFVAPDQLSEVARPLGQVDLDIPEVRLQREAGALILQLWIDVSGTVVHAEVQSSTLMPAYEAALVRMFSSLSYMPGQRDGHAVNSLLRIETRYE